jgi:hypothetical protein
MQNVTMLEDYLEPLVMYMNGPSPLYPETAMYILARVA